MIGSPPPSHVKTIKSSELIFQKSFISIIYLILFDLLNQAHVTVLYFVKGKKFWLEKAKILYSIQSCVTVMNVLTHLWRDGKKWQKYIFKVYAYTSVQISVLFFESINIDKVKRHEWWGGGGAIYIIDLCGLGILRVFFYLQNISLRYTSPTLPSNKIYRKFSWLWIMPMYVRSMRLC